MKNLNRLLPFYKDTRRRIFIVILFLSMFLIILFFDISVNPYPPIVRFTQNNKFITGELYLNNEFLGTMKQANFDKLPDEYCIGTHILSIDVDEVPLGEWKINRTHCKSNLVTFEISKS